MKTLTEILDFYGSDKGFSSGDRHNDLAVYGALLASRRDDNVHLVEFGVAPDVPSARGWSFFLTATFMESTRI